MDQRKTVLKGNIINEYTILSAFVELGAVYFIFSIGCTVAMFISLLILNAVIFKLIIPTLNYIEVIDDTIYIKNQLNPLFMHEFSVSEISKIELNAAPLTGEYFKFIFKNNKTKIFGTNGIDRSELDSLNELFDTK